MHSDCAWDKKCVLAPLPLSHPDSGSIFVYKCITRLQYNNNEDLRQDGKFNILKILNIFDNYKYSHAHFLMTYHFILEILIVLL